MSPSTGDSSGGTTIIITGANFQTGAIVRVGGKSAIGIVVTNGASIQAVTAPNAPGTYEVQVINPDGQSGTRLAAFTYLAAPAPTLIQVLPNSGPSPGGTVVNLSGANYQAGAAVLFGGAAATNVTLISPTQLQATTPGSPAGIVNVQVINPDSQSVTFTGGFTFTLGAAPTITTVLPTQGPSNGGTIVSITGTDFAPGATVQFGGVAASSVVVTSATQINATTPPHSAGPADIIVRNPDNQTATRPAAFNFVPPPGISAVSPVSGTQAGGTVVTVTGSAFQNGVTVSFGGVAATSVTTQSTAQLQATTPAHAPGTFDVVVRNPDGQTGTLPSAYTFNLGPAPAIIIVAPSSGPVSGGTSVIITGTNFQTGVAVAFGASAATSVTLNILTQTITAVTPASSAGVVDVTVTNADGQAGMFSNGFNYLPAPVVATVTPAVGPTSGGTAVLISGTDFQAGATVRFGSTAATSVTVSSATLIQATSPAGAAGAVGVTVTNPDTQSNTLAGGFTYSTAPVVSSVTPSTGPVAGGTTVTIMGLNFVSGATVRFGANSATGVVFNSPTSITAVTPAGAAGAVSVTVTNPSTQSGTLPLAFTYAPPPAPGIISVFPTSGAASGGTPIVITGSDFQAGATVTIGGTAATGVVVVSANSITAVTPAHAAGTVDVVVTNPVPPSATLFSGFTYNPPPTVGSVVFNSGPTSGGTVVIVNGTNFQTGATILFGSTPATGVVFLSPTQYRATTPAQTVGAVSVRVTNPDGQFDTLATAFTYTAAPAPTVSSVAPGSGPAGGGTQIAITGTNFVAGATVLVGGSAASNVVVSSATQITADTPTHGAGTFAVQVRNPDGQASSSTISASNSFTFDAAPTISSVSPNTGTTAGGTVVTINGTNFVAGAVVSFGGTSATSVTVTSATQIQATTPAGSAGAVSVSVLNPDGQAAVMSGAFTYSAPAPAPIVSSVLPSNGSQNGGTTVTIAGTGFQTGAAVLFGTNPATGAVVNSASSITAVTPAGTPGPVTVRVTNPDTQFGTRSNAFFYLVSSVIIKTTDLPDGNLQVPYTIGFAGSGGGLPYRWTLSSGTLPPGLTLDTNTGFLDGVPAQNGSFSFVILVTDSVTPSAQTATASFTLNVVPVPTGANVARFPQAFVDTRMPVQTGTVRNVTACTQLQSTINSAALGDTIVIDSSLTCTGQFTLPEKTSGSGWIIIRSSAMTNLPPEGTRIKPAIHAPFMPKILTNGVNGRALRALLRAHHYRLIGIEVSITAGLATTDALISFDPAATTFSEYPNFLVVDRCYIHGTPTSDTRRGVGLGANNVAIIDSNISEIHSVGFDTQTIGGWNFRGPLKIVNNYLEAAAENVAFGGSDPVVTGVLPSDIEIRRNHIFKPLSWRPADPSYAGIAWLVKNSFEVKDGQRILFEGNIVENSWLAAQAGYLVILTPAFQLNKVPQAVVQDVVMRNNSFVHASGWINSNYTSPGDTAAGPASPPDVTCDPLQIPIGCLRARRWHFHDNVAEDISRANWSGDGRVLQILGPTDFITFENNTAFEDGSPLLFGSPGPALNPNRFTLGLIYRNNITSRAALGVFGAGTAEGTGSLNFHAPGFTWVGNVIVGANASSYPPSNFYPAGSMPANVNFFNFNGGLGGDYRLQPASPFKNAGSNGKDPGARAGATAAAVTGVR